MYTKYFGFRRDPFADTADPDFFYTNPIYQKARTTLLAGIREYKGFLLLTGETGTGKTTLLRWLMKDVKASGHYVFFDSTSLASATIDDLLYFICAELGLHGDDNGRVAKLRMFNAYLNTLVGEGGTGVLLIDEAHHLNDEVLGGLRLIAPLDMKSERLLLQIVLVGQPELERRLEEPKLRPIRQRVALRCRLERLKDEEIASYIRHRLETVGCERQDLFDTEALRRIARSSHGVPRLINIICDNALLLAYGEKSHTVSAQLIDEAVEKLRIDELTNSAPAIEQTAPLQVSSLVPAPAQIPVRAQAVVPARSDEPTSGSGDVIGAVPRRRAWGYLTLGLVLGLGAGWVLVQQSAPLRSLFPPPAPVITRVSPAINDPQPLVLPEGQSQVFTVEASSPQPEMLRYVWFMNGKEVATGTSWTYQPQFDEGGQQKTVIARVTDANQQTVERRWDIQIQEVNRLPQITHVSPQEQTIEVQKGAHQSFTVAVEDPDTDQRVETAWFLDEEKVAQGPRWTFSPLPTTGEGHHTVKVTGTDAAGAKVERQWIVTVAGSVPEPLRIIHTRPVTANLNIKEGQAVTFAVEVANPRPEVRYVWLLDGKEMAQGQRWTYRPQFTEGGQEKTVTVQVRHPAVQSEERSWKVSVQDVDRPPVIVAAEPRTPLVRMREGEGRHFVISMTDPDPNDRLNAVWRLDGKEVAQGQTWTFALPPDETSPQHTVTVAVTDQNGLRTERQWKVTVAATEGPPLRITNVQPAQSELDLAIDQPMAFAVEVPKDRVEAQYVWLLDGQEQSRQRTWTYAPQPKDGETNKTVTVRVRDRDNHSVEQSWQLHIRAMVPPPAPPPVLNESEVRAWVEAQRRALEGRDVDALVELGALNNQQAERAREILSQYQDFRVTFRHLAVHVEGDRAEVSFSRIDTIEGIEVPHADRKHFVLQKGADGRLKVRPQ